MTPAPTKRAREWYRRPCGLYTLSVKLYIREWRTLTRPLGRLLDAHPHGWDPGMSFIPKRNTRGYIHLDLRTALYVLDVNGLLPRRVKLPSMDPPLISVRKAP